MLLTFDEIRSITCGAVTFAQEAEGICFHRFSQKQRDLYEVKKMEFYLKALGTAGIKLCFRTDSEHLHLRALVEHTCTRKYFSFDIFADGKPVGYLDNYSDLELPKDYSVQEFAAGAFEKTFLLGKGEKTVTIHLPWNMKVTLRELSLDDGAFVTPVKPGKKLLAFGDSITQGFDSLRPSRRYISQLAAAWDAEEFNKAIGGECFCPELAAMKEDFQPDIITVAYGTNDWSKTTPEVLEANSRAFFLELQKNYPNTIIYALGPIWRSNEATLAQTRKPFCTVEETIRNATADMDNVTVIHGYDLVPHSVDYFGDYGLHPRNEGFDHYAANILKALRG